ncbi:MAG: alkene reductase [Bifidobacteriaceae bacterium]|jgi:N-ethylmaleimide reductase|nr:alkene reductase [Bifidobacteriaceae bacterium]
MNAIAFEPFTLSGLTLQNRIVMAPMTRTRAIGSVPGELVAEYYTQRASAGLIITEGVAPSDVGIGYPDTPGLYSEPQIAGWRSVTEAVHAAGGAIFAQIMHVGRIGDPSLHRDGQNTVAPSAIAAEGQIYTHQGMIPYVVPDPMTPEVIRQTIADYVNAARNAVEAGFDGVELHGANGYLIHQFLSSSANIREDEWGGDIDGHIRFAVEVAQAVVAAIGSHRVGFRISPANTLHSITETATRELYLKLISELSPLKLAYLHLAESNAGAEHTAELVAAWPGALILNPFTGDRPTDASDLELIGQGVDLISFGTNFIGTPDLPLRLRQGAALNPLRPQFFYGISSEGYTDYPALSGS